MSKQHTMGNTTAKQYGMNYIDFNIIKVRVFRMIYIHRVKSLLQRHNYYTFIINADFQIYSFSSMSD
jgi:hypothetical protein